MGKRLTEKQVKRLPVGTDVYLVNDATGEAGMFWVIKSGRKKMLRCILGVLEIKDKDGWHYEEVGE